MTELATVDNGVLLAEIVEQPPKPWGLWATLGLSLAVAMVLEFVQTVVVLAYMFAAAGGNPERLSHVGGDVATNGLLLSVASWIALPFVVGLIVLLTRARRWSARDYLALHPISWKALFAGLGSVVLLVAAFECLDKLAGPVSNGEFMIRIYKTAGFLPLLWATLLIEAPLMEEFFFRGFMFRGIQQSGLGSLGAIAITSVSFTVMHVQYNAYELLWVLALGVLLGIARWKSGSVYLAMAMHAFANLIAMAEVAMYVAAGG